MKKSVFHSNFHTSNELETRRILCLKHCEPWNIFIIIFVVSFSPKHTADPHFWQDWTSWRREVTIWTLECEFELLSLSSPHLTSLALCLCKLSGSIAARSTFAPHFLLFISPLWWCLSSWRFWISNIFSDCENEFRWCRCGWHHPTHVCVCLLWGDGNGVDEMKYL